MKASEFNSVFTGLLTEKLKKFSNRKLDLTVCIEIYQSIFNTLVDVFEIAGTGLSNEGMNYLAQQYYDGVLINGREELDPNIFTQRAKIENIDTKELTFLAVALNGTDFAIPLIQEIKKRG